MSNVLLPICLLSEVKTEIGNHYRQVDFAATKAGGDEIENFGVIEYVNEREYLNSSPCDIILKDS